MARHGGQGEGQEDQLEEGGREGGVE
jgi:hypothetical protein